MFRVSQRGEGIDDADTIERAREIVRGESPGRYEVEEIRAEPFPSGHTSRSWSRLIRHPDGGLRMSRGSGPTSEILRLAIRFAINHRGLR
jgi:hypothetical protein